MDIIFGVELPLWRSVVIERLARGEVAILPTDTLYGLSCSGLSAAAVARVDRLKRRRRPSTLIPPSLEWAQRLVPPRWRAALSQLDRNNPGATLLLPLRPDRHAQLPVASLIDSGQVGLRWPRHWIRQLASDCGLPLVSTSVNLTGRPPMRGWDNLPASIARGVDFIVYEGPLPGPASPIIHCDGRRPRRVVR